MQKTMHSLEDSTTHYQHNAAELLSVHCSTCGAAQMQRAFEVVRDTLLHLELPTIKAALPALLVRCCSTKSCAGRITHCIAENEEHNVDVDGVQVGGQFFCLQSSCTQKHRQL